MSARWTFWEGWRGPPELVAHVARAAVRAVGAGATSPSIELRVGADVELFDNAKDFLESATADGLRRFTTLALDVEGTRGRVRVEWKRDEAAANAVDAASGRDSVFGIPMLDAPIWIARQIRTAWREEPPLIGVWLAVTANTEKQAQQLLDAVVPAIERAVNAGRVQKRLKGDAAGLEAVDTAIGDRRRGRRNWPKVITLSFLLVAVVVGLFGYATWLIGEVTTSERADIEAEIKGEATSDDNPFLGGPWVWFVLGGALVGLAVAGGVQWIAPRVEVSPQQRWQRVAGVVYKGFFAVVLAALVSNGVRLLLGSE